MDLSVVIRCNDDERVFDCIESIDEDVEIIVSTSENPVFQAKLESRSISYCLSPRGNLSRVSNIGFNKAKYDKVIITDSDTVFKEGSIREMYLALDHYKVVRARIEFVSDKNKFFSRTIAEARDFVNSLPVVYTPGIGVRKELVADVGGFLFNDPVPFAVDADLDYRIKKAGLSVKYLDSAVLYHDAEDIFHDLKAAYRIGAGCMTSAIYLSKQMQNIKLAPRKIAHELKGVKLSCLGDIIRQKGLRVFLYQIIWDIFFYAGKNWRWITKRELYSGADAL